MPGIPHQPDPPKRRPAGSDGALALEGGAGAAAEGRGSAREAETLMYFVTWTLFGLIIGIVAHWRYLPANPGGVTVASLVGIAGALLGGFAGAALDLYEPSAHRGLVAALVGAALLEYGYGTLMRRTRR